MLYGERPTINESRDQVHFIFHRYIKEREVPPSWLPEIVPPIGLDLSDEHRRQTIDVRLGAAPPQKVH